MASLDIAEKRLPQDGRVGLTVGGHPIDIRMASLPSVKGEKVVLRILDKEQALIGLERLGMQDDTLDRFRNSFTRSYGATFVTGPTGSGKTTSLYAALNQINSPERNIITIEDPVEYQIPGPHPGAGQPQGRPHVRLGPALDRALGPRRDHGR